MEILERLSKVYLVGCSAWECDLCSLITRFHWKPKNKLKQKALIQTQEPNEYRSAKQLFIEYYGIYGTERVDNVSCVRVFSILYMFNCLYTKCTGIVLSKNKFRYLLDSPFLKIIYNLCNSNLINYYRRNEHQKRFILSYRINLTSEFSFFTFLRVKCHWFGPNFVRSNCIFYFPTCLDSSCICSSHRSPVLFMLMRLLRLIIIILIFIINN